MKRSMLVAALTLSLSSAVFAQEVAAPPPPPPPVAPATPAPPAAVEHRSKLIMVQPILWVFGAYGLGFEVGVLPKLAVVLGANFYAFSFTTGQTFQSGMTAFTTSTTVNVLGGLFQPGIAWFLIGRAPTGLWLSPKLELGYVSIGTSSTFSDGVMKNGSSTTNAGFVFGAQGMVGYTHAFDIGLSVQLGVGFGFNYTAINQSTMTTAGPLPAQPTQPFTFLGSFGRISAGLGWNF